MVAIHETVDVSALPLAPENPMSYREKMDALRNFHTGFERMRDAGGPVSRVVLGPKWLVQPIVVVTSPRGGRDMIGRSGAFVDKTASVHVELRKLLGGNLFSLPHAEWLPRRRSLQHVFTKKHVLEFGGHMAQAAQAICDSWSDGAQIDLDSQCRLLTLRALGRSILGIDLDECSDQIAGPLQVTLSYVADRAMSPLRAPSWLPTPARRRARNASKTLHKLAHDILMACRRDPDRDAPLVRALLDAVDPDTGRSLSDDEICDELIVFMLAGHDTTATTLTYALWQLGQHRHLQDRVRAEVHALGPAGPTPEDVSRLTYTTQVLHEALRLCPPGAALTRTAVRDIEVDGYRVEAGTLVAFGIWAVQRDPALWPDPLSFDPERFRPDRAKQIERYQYLPFGAGPRSCIGDHFAMLEATLALATIIGRCEIGSLTDDFPIAVPFTVVASEPVQAIVVKR
ncbi:cytochrome P450 [Mycolicibacterium sp. BK634]|uniref:cytochrome P450 n=1 Tax=Mycobacteriaceae TaxID=1762 RepID=UPI0010606063|nr:MULTISPECIES: cytochrome P450 [Mycobacteriaceae]MBB3753233.1 cytochrome P450 [Mycolicibacterium sp. BK634]TDO09004.1 cytochrome P450 [Mycobacterium sp. BK086]